MTRLFAILIALCSFSPLIAGETDWVEIAPDTSVRLVSSDSLDADGILWMGLEFDMPLTTKTYWRVPGETGIPLSVDTADAQGIIELDVVWPYPVRETTAGYVDHAFYGRVLLPLQVAVEGDAPRIVTDLTLGVCSDICVPAAARLELAPDLTTPDRANGLRIRQALAEVPLPHAGDDILGDAAFDSESGALVVALYDKAFDPASMIAEIAGSLHVFGPPEMSPNADALVFPLLGRSNPGAFDAASARFTYDSTDGPYEISRVISP